MMTKMKEGYKEEDVEKVLQNTVRHVIIGMDESGGICIMYKKPPENDISVDDDELANIGLAYQGLRIITQNTHDEITKAI